MNDNIRFQYNDKIARAEIALKQTKRKIMNVSTFRLVLFIAGIIGLFVFYSNGVIAIAAVIVLTFLPFLVLVKYHNRLFNRKEWLETVIKVYSDEIKALDNDISPFDGGEDYIDPSHRYSYDLDIFGNNHTLFQALNRTSTQTGKDKLASWLNNHLEDCDKIVERQNAVKELSGMLDFREDFRVLGLIHESKKDDYKSIEEWIDMPSIFYTRKWIKYILWLIPSVNLLLFILALFDIISFTWFGLSIFFFIILSLATTRKISKIQSVYENKLSILTSYASLISLVEKQDFKDELLNGIKSKFYISKNGSEIVIAELNKYLGRLDLKNNLILYTILEGTMFWQLRQIYAIEEWKNKYGKNLLIWMNALSDFDALISIADFAYNHSFYTYPTLCEKPFTFEAKNMGHPLMDNDKCVLNDSEIPYRPYFLIVTGANMAGKSTYLRTVGVNYLLACIGAPVYCSSLRITPSKLMTSLRTTDSLSNNESYFFAEIKRLSEIINRLKNGEEMFIILDEILKGTNSIDKQKGSFSLVQQLIELNSNGIIATHDLLLGKLEEMFPKNIKNYRFEADIIDNNLSFSYKLREGIAENMNACFLMKKMGIDIKE